MKTRSLIFAASLLAVAVAAGIWGQSLPGTGTLAPLASPVFTGTPSLPTGTTATTQSANDNSTKLATTAYADAAATAAATIAAPYITVGGIKYGPVFAMTGPTAANTWTWVNQGSSTATNTNGSLAVVAPAASGDNFRLLVKTAPSTPWTVSAFIQASNFPVTAGLGWRQASDGKFVICANGSSSSTPSMSVIKYTNVTTFSAIYTQANYMLQPQSGMWLQISDDGTNRKCSSSIDGVTWETLHSVARTDFLTADQYGIVMNVSSTVVGGQLNLLSLVVQ